MTNDQDIEGRGVPGQTGVDGGALLETDRVPRLAAVGELTVMKRSGRAIWVSASIEDSLSSSASRLAVEI